MHDFAYHWLPNQPFTLLAPHRQWSREFGGGPAAVSPLLRELSSRSAVPPQFMTESDHSTSKADGSSQKPTIHDACIGPADQQFPSITLSSKACN